MRVIAIGDFDGVHLGHRKILNTLIGWAASLHAEPVALSFTRNTKGRRVISSPAAKQALFRRCGLAEWRLLPFEEWKDTPAAQFAEDFLKGELQTAGVVCGADFCFGRGREGNTFTLIEKGIAVKKIEDETVNGLRVSSSAIRAAIAAGALREAEAMMGHPFLLAGTVARGKGLAHRHGLPTVNLPLAEDQLLPPFGVYVASAVVNGARLPAVANIGVRPTLEQTDLPNLEAHLMADMPDLYGKELEIELLAFLRPEQRFESEEALFRRIRLDLAQCRAEWEAMK